MEITGAEQIFSHRRAFCGGDSLFIGRTRRRVGLSGGDGFFGGFADCNAPDGFDLKSFCRVNRRVPVLPARIFRLESFSVVCRDFDSVCILGRKNPICRSMFTASFSELFCFLRRFVWRGIFRRTRKFVAPKLWIALVVGAFIGLLSGLVGVGGGIFLTPVLLLMNWTEARTAAGISAMFILVNSAAGLLGNYQQVYELQSNVIFWIIAAVLGGIIGSTLGSRYFNTLVLRRVLAVVLVSAAVKLIFT